MRWLFPILLCACGLDSFGTGKTPGGDEPGADSGLHGLDSGEDANQAPDAQAGIDQVLYVQSVAELDGGFSFDPDGDPLAFEWTLDAAPTGSTSNIINENSEQADLYLDIEGLYEISLEVSDGAAADVDTMTVLAEAPNGVPVADAGADQTVPVGASVQLSGGNSHDPDGDPLTFEWRMKSKPNGSGATLAVSGGGLAGFQADLAGNYMIELIVDDGVDSSAQDTVKVTAVEESSGGGCDCGERVRREMRSKPWLFGIVILPQSYLGPILFGFWARRRRKKDSDLDQSE